MNLIINKLLTFKEKLFLNDYKLNKSLKSILKGSEIIKEHILNDSPFFGGRLGSVESGIISKYSKKIRLSKKKLNLILDEMYVNAGVYPRTRKTMEEYAQLMISQVLINIDIMGVWHTSGETFIINKICNKKKMKFIPLRSLEVFLYNINRDSNWIYSLKNKKILIISPFVKTFESQSKKLHLIWNDPFFIENNLHFKFLEAPLQPIFNKNHGISWFDTLEELKAKISLIDYDIALIGAGAYSLPLANYCKLQNKKALHMGGSLQLFFGVNGNRWKSHPFVNKKININWTRLEGVNKPDNYKLVEGGCYW